MFFDYFASAVAEPRREKGAPIPLFERLIDEEVGETFEIPPRRFYNRFELIQSIEREVYRILNTRSTARRDDYGYLDLDQENFGLPQMFGMADFSQFDGANTGHWPKIAKICELAIERYEPRLKNVRLSIQSFDRQDQCLIANVEADLDIPHFQGEVTFPMGINT
jgi:type VI secretion system lysozyme-like protein